MTDVYSITTEILEIELLGFRFIDINIDPC